MLNRSYIRFKSLFIDRQNTIEDVNQHDNLTKPLFWMLVLAVVAAALLLAIDLYGLKDGTGTSLGTFGDFFGGVLNPIFTFLTFFGLIITIVIQRMELRLAREEYEKTATALNTQAIESTFFNTLVLHHKIVDGLRYDPNRFRDIGMDRLRELAGMPHEPRLIYTGRDVFDAIADDLSRRASNPTEALENYKVLQSDQNQILGHYFRNLYQALKTIDSYPTDSLHQEQKEKYSGILRAQLSSNELALLLLNCSDSIVDQGQFRNLLVTYKMLEHLPLSLKDGVYRAGNRELPVADENTIVQFLKLTRIERVPATKGRGAFGNNPTTIPGIDA